ncbi:hypothetical protein F4779DRAFT_123621 [Xylariaceae sp. FL0662B]|nr:hypothetical protein F4779DRAFT_123621 [Xylariaceae sp. FL0662B]
MQLRSVVTVAGFAVTTTNAFLLPPEISESDDDIVTTLPVPIETDVDIPKIAQAQSLKLKCPGCPIRLPNWRHPDDDAKITTDIPSHLELDFSVESSDSADRLLLNGFELYPNADPFRNALTAAVRPDVAHRRPHFKGPKLQHVQTLGFGMQTRPVVKSDEDALELVMIELDIIEVGDVFVDGIPNVQVKLVKTDAGKLMIGDIETLPAETTQKNPMDKQEECATQLCKWKAVVMEKLAGLRLHKGCGGRPALVKGVDEQVEASHPEDYRYKQGHSWRQLFKNVTSHILLPIAIGILAGVTASIIGMMIGTLIIFLWRTFVRRGGSRRHHRHGSIHKAAHREMAVGDEKSGLMTHQEEIDAPPAWVEIGLKVADNKKSENDA